ncbi:MAG: HAD hydrolase-like protein [Candidatus Sedimenticola sp. (ex Thyasira tokunagai)]
MFDVDGTIVQSNDIDNECYIESVKEVIGITPDKCWSNYENITDSGILSEILLKENVIGEYRDIMNKVKNIYITKLNKRISQDCIIEVPGASEFIDYLHSRKDVVLSIATGGWFESAILKLRFAGIEFKNIPIASSNDHYSKAEIMRIAESRSLKNMVASNTYFGDSEYDKNASEDLGYNFILVGNSIVHDKRISDFTSINEVMLHIYS